MVSALKQVTVLYAGRVQGVGFRASTLHIARGFEVRGTVHNTPDGSVELTAEGPAAELEAFLTAIDESELAGFIKEKKVSWAPAEGRFQSFRIV